MEAIYPIKIQRPALSNVFIRQRLFDLIDEYSDKKIYWVSGPGGAGKTTLINSYLYEQKASCIWYHVDESDHDLAGFFYYLGLAGNVTASNHEVRFPNFTPEYMFGMREFSRNFFEKLFQIQQPETYLVFDNCQEIPDDSELFTAILSGMSRMKAGSRIILISRNELPLPFLRLRANDELGVIGPNDLRLTVDELKALSGLKNIRLQTDQLQKLHHQLDGWAAGFQIITGAGNFDELAEISFENELRDSKETIFNYFAEEIFRHLDSSEQETLLITSLLPHLDTSLLGELRGSAETTDIIKELCRKNIFIHKQLGLPGIYNYHQLFKEFLRNRCKQVFSADEIRKILSDAATLYANQGKIEEAVSLQIQAENWEDVISLVSEHGAAFLRQGRFLTLGSWLQQFPENTARTNPWILYWTAMCLMLQAPDKAQSLFDQALTVFKRNGDVVGMYLTLSGMGESLAYRFDTFVLYDQWIESLEMLLDKYPYFPSIEIEARITLVMMTAIAMRQPSYVHADEWRSRALTLVNSGNELDGSIRIHILNSLILERTLTGYLTEADLLITSFKNSVGNQDIPPLVTINLINFEALYNWRSGNSQKCLEAVSEGLMFAEQSGVHIISFILLVNGVSGALIDDNFEQADSYLDHLESQLDHAGSYRRLIYHLSKIWRFLAENRWGEALTQCKYAMQMAPLVGNAESLAISYLAHSLALRASADFDHAERELEKAIRLCESHPIHQVAFGCHLTKAEVCFSSGQEVKGVEALQEGLTIGSKMAYHMFPLWRGDVIATLCVKALESGIHEDYVQRLIEQRQLFPARPPVHLENWPWELKIYCLGSFKIVINGEVLRFRGKTQQKPIELLKALISLGGKDVSELLLSDILWPDADGDMQHQSFNTTLHRLRKILKVDDILFLNAGVLSLNKEKCWVDVWAFDSLVSDSDIIDQFDQAASTRTIKARAAINLYRGLFLSNDDEGWVMRTREKLHRQYLSLIEELAREIMDNCQWREAINLYEKGIEADPFTANFYYQLMQCHSYLGHNASALQVYDQYMKNLGGRHDQEFRVIHKLLERINGIPS